MLAKSAKVIPVMLMGKLVSRTQYKNYEYATAVLISVGMTAFLLGSDDGKKGMKNCVGKTCAGLKNVIY